MTLRLGLLSSFTVDLLADELNDALRAAGGSADIHVGGFGQYRQEILDPTSPLAAFRPDVTVLLLDFSDIFTDLVRSPVEVTAEVRERRVADECETVSRLCAHLRERLPSSSVIVGNVVAPASALGPLEVNSEHSLRAVARAFNTRLETWAQRQTAVYIVDVEGLAATLGHVHWWDERLRYLARMPLSAAATTALAREIVTLVHAVRGASRKVLVLDADNTLWGGVIGEDGIDKIQLGPEGLGAAYMDFQRDALTLKAQGVLLALSSKNNRADVMDVLDKHPSMLLRADSFSSLKIDWRDKATHLKEIAADLNVGLDSLVFVDDNPVETDLVKMQLPTVLTVTLPEDPTQFRPVLRALGAFTKLRLTTEDRERSQLYHEQSQRESLRQSVTSLDDFYASLQMRAVIRPMDDFSRPRLAQLTQRTNQFNLTAVRLSEADLSQLAASGRAWIYSLQLTDKFGDSGIVGMAVLEKETDTAAALRVFLMSCRVIGRTVEDAFLGFVLRDAKKQKLRTVAGDYHPTSKNDQVKDFYPRRGFAADPSRAGRWVFDLSQEKMPSSPWIAINEEPS